MAGRIRRALRGPRLIVLCYHRVDMDASRPAFSALPGDFARQIEWFASRFRILGLREVAAFLAGESHLSGDAIALTFDDGYIDNRHIVQPVLARKGLPAAFFIASGPLLERSAYWYDALWDGLGRAGEAGDRASRQATLNSYKGLSKPDRERVLAGVVPIGTGPSACETMTVEDAWDCSRSGIEIGGHTRSHPSLARVPVEECEQEIRNGIGDLRREGFPVRAFAYPFGEAVDTGGREGFPRRVLASISGIELAFTTEERAVRPGEDPLLIPRKVISPQTLAQIALRLEILSWHG
jgi:peptidoglycan/xylan/chitin deacetylase (PgdA/CDA1 family)